MEERRAAVRLLAALGLAAAGPALACDPPLEGTRLESSRHVLTYKLDLPAVGKHFSIDVGACARSGKPPETLAVDAQMPEHRHGMNYRPEVKKVAPGRWRADGLLFHMPGKWQLEFVVDGERMARDVVVFTREQTKTILSHGPWPPAPRRDPTNRVSGKPEAIALGERLFFEPRLSGTGSVLCATCHVPFRQFQDARARAFGLELVDRNTPTLVNAGFYRWYGWDGAQDSLWAQSIRPILDEREMRASPSHVSRLLKARFAADYKRAFNREVPPDDEEALVDAGKALAAFQETLVSGRTPFDDFRDALERGVYLEKYPLAAQRGLAIFVGKGNCSVCHFGPSFTNSEFADTGITHFVARGRVDGGRLEGIKRLKASPYNLLGRFSDDRSGGAATGTKHVELQHRNFGEFRVPGLRNVALTAPYMHDGSLAALRDVVRHYSELDEERLHADGERILRPLRLSASESADLVAFLESLSQMVRRD
jgi:cytochrome c peroxidase